MAIDPAIVSSTSALLGALAGGGATLATAVYTQRYQDRLQRVARESLKRETVYAEFIMCASTVLINAYSEDGLTLGQDKQQLVGILQRIRLFAPPHVIQEAEKVMQTILEIALQPGIDFRTFTSDDLVKTRDSNILDSFSMVCRTDLDDLHVRIR